MISETEALAAILTSTEVLTSHSLDLLSATDHVAAESCFAEIPYPVFDQSSMDGYAICSTDSSAAHLLEVIAEQPAGKKRDLKLSKGQAIRIFTGAPLPAGSDAVIMQEDVELIVKDSEHKCIRCLEPVEVNENIRRRGSDIAIGQKGIQHGDILHPAKIAWLASQGKAEITVVRKPRIAIITTGDELVPSGRSLQEGELYESNGVMLASLCKSLGFAQVQMFHCKDELEATQDLIANLENQFDLLLFSGGVSVGDYDFVKPALSSQGFETEFWRVAIKPGKPLIFSTKRNSKGCVYAFGLPGNPVSAWVTFMLFVKPCLSKLSGWNDEACYPKFSNKILAQEISNPEKRTHYFRGIETAQGVALIGAQASHAIGGLLRATHLIKIPAGTSKPAGDTVEVLPI